jgi:hypothetical protein
VIAGGVAAVTDSLDAKCDLEAIETGDLLQIGRTINQDGWATGTGTGTDTDTDSVNHITTNRHPGNHVSVMGRQ